jgi:anti-anti-sigma regulatory factor
MTLLLKNDFPVTISTRKVVAEYCKQIDLSSTKEYILDFSEISFISRSSADEFLKSFANAMCKWHLINYNSNIKSMFDAVAHTQNQDTSDYEKVAITPFLDKQELSRFLAVI